MSISGERRRYFKSEAKSLLRYNYFKQVFMTGLITLLTFGINAIKISIVKLLELEYSFYSVPADIFFDLLGIFVTLPLYIGIIYVNIKLFEGENISIEGMFHYFSSGANLLDCYKFITAMAARFIIFAVPFMLFGIFFPVIKESVELIFTVESVIEIDITMICICVVYLIILFISVIFFMRYFATVFVFVKNPCLSVKDIIHKSAKMMKKKKFESLKLILSFSIWILISHYLAGFLYIFFTLPYIMLSYASFMSFVLCEKGGDEFLTPAGEYIDKIVRKTNKSKKVKIKIDGNLDRLKKITKIRKKQKI